jgi:hypothetical protein
MNSQDTGFWTSLQGSDLAAVQTGRIDDSDLAAVQTGRIDD